MMHTLSRFQFLHRMKDLDSPFDDSDLTSLAPYVKWFRDVFMVDGLPYYTTEKVLQVLNDERAGRYKATAARKSLGFPAVSYSV